MPSENKENIQTISIDQFFTKWEELENQNHPLVIIDVKDPTISFLLGKWMRKKMQSRTELQWIDESNYSAAKWLNDFCTYDMFIAQKLFFISHLEELNSEIYQVWEKSKKQIIENIRLVAIQKKKTSFEKLVSSDSGFLLKVSSLNFWQMDSVFRLIREIENYSYPVETYRKYLKDLSWDSSNLYQFCKKLQLHWLDNSEKFEEKMIEEIGELAKDKFKLLDLINHKKYLTFFLDFYQFLENASTSSDLFSFYSLMRSHMMKLFDYKTGKLEAHNQYEKKIMTAARIFTVKEINQWMKDLSSWEVATKLNKDTMKNIVQLKISELKK